MSFTEKIVVAKFSAKGMYSGKVMQFIYYTKSYVIALFSVNPMYSVNLVSVKVMLHCTITDFKLRMRLQAGFTSTTQTLPAVTRQWRLG